MWYSLHNPEESEKSTGEVLMIDLSLRPPKVRVYFYGLITIVGYLIPNPVFTNT